MTDYVRSHSRMYDPEAQVSHNIQGVTEDYGLEAQGSISRPAFRPAVYTQSFWGGLHSWQTWSDLEYPPEYRERVTKGAIADTAQITLLNNMPQPASFAPIAIQDYALATNMIYQQGGGSFNYYG